MAVARTPIGRLALALIAAVSVGATIDAQQNPGTVFPGTPALPGLSAPVAFPAPSTAAPPPPPRPAGGTLPQSPSSVLTAAGSIAFWDHLAQSTDLVTERGARLLLLLLDVNGDRRPEIFIAPASLCGNGGCQWSVYSPTTDPAMVRYLGEAFFPPNGFRVDASSGALAACSHLSAEACSLVQYTFGQGSMTHHDGGECRTADAACASALRAIDAWQAANRAIVLQAVVSADDVLSGLRWTRAPDRTAAVPDFDHLRVASAR